MSGWLFFMNEVGQHMIFKSQKKRKEYHGTIYNPPALV